MKIIFMGTPDFSVPILERIIEQGHEVVAAYTQPPRPAGRGKKVKKSPVHLLAEDNNIEVVTPTSLKSEQEQERFVDYRADIAVVVAYGMILPKAILDVCDCVNIHASILPRWRGAAPIHRAIMAGDTKTGISIMRMDEGLDTGDVMLTRETAIDEDMSGGELHNRLSMLGADCIVDALADIKLGNAVYNVQNHNDSCYADKILKSEAKIDFNKDVLAIRDMIRAFNPWPGAYFEHKGENIKILSADIVAKEHSYKYGSIVDDKLTLAAKGGFVMPKIVQRPGKKPMDTNEMLRGMAT